MNENTKKWLRIVGVDSILGQWYRSGSISMWVEYQDYVRFLENERAKERNGPVGASPGLRGSLWTTRRQVYARRVQ